MIVSIVRQASIAILSIGVISLLAYCTAITLAFLVHRRRVGRATSNDAERETLLSSRFTIPVSVLLPVGDREETAVACVHSLLALNYPEFELIVVGSDRGMLDRLKEEFDLVPREIFFRRVLSTAPVHRMYRTRRHPRLTVVDKARSGIADALNCGVNLARFRYLCCVTADVVYDTDALLKAMPVVLKDPGAVIGVTSGVRVGSDSAKSLATAFEHLASSRSMLEDRLIWRRLEFTLCQGHQFSVWRRDAIIELTGFGGAEAATHADMAVRVKEEYARRGRACRLIPLVEQVGRAVPCGGLRRRLRDRAGALAAALCVAWRSRGMFGHPRYGTAGLLGMPYFVGSMIFAPYAQILFILTGVVAAAMGLLTWWGMALLLLLNAFALALVTGLALLADETSGRPRQLGDLRRLTALAPLEFVICWPAFVFSTLQGTADFLRSVVLRPSGGCQRH